MKVSRVTDFILVQIYNSCRSLDRFSIGTSYRNCKFNKHNYSENLYLITI